MNKSEHWLVFSHCYNMDGRAASQLIKPRVVELSKRGIKCTVISAPNGAYDPSVFKHSRVFSCFPAGLKFELRHWIRREIQSKTPPKRILLSMNSILLSPFAIIERILIPLKASGHGSLVYFHANIFLFAKLEIHKPDLLDRWTSWWALCEYLIIKSFSHSLCL